MQSLLQEFRQFIDDVYGTYLDSLEGFRHVSIQANALQARAEKEIGELKARNSEYDNLEFGGVSHAYGRLIKSGGEAWRGHLHQVEVSDLISRNMPDGRNHMIMGRMFVVTVYQYWDDHIRKKIERALGLTENGIIVPILGDVRLFRISIIHNHSQAKPEVEKCEVLKWFSKGDTISFEKKQVEEIVDRLMQFIDEFGSDPGPYTRAAIPGRSNPTV
jgi:hypothetical protein